MVNNTLFLVGGNTNDQLNVTPIGASPTGSTGVKVNGKLDNININNQTFTGVTTIYAVGFGGNDKFQFAGSLTIATDVHDGDGNDQIQLGNGTNTVIAGIGNDNIQAGDGSDTIMAGAAGSKSNIQVQLGNGANNLVTLFGNGNDQVKAGNGAGDMVTITGNGNDLVKLGDGNDDSVAITGDGNDQVQIGNGMMDSVAIVGNGNDDVQTGTGSGTVHIAGTGHKNVHLGKRWMDANLTAPSVPTRDFAREPERLPGFFVVG